MTTANEAAERNGERESLQEYTDSRGLALRVDADAGVLVGVKLLGLASRNGRQYREGALERAVPLYEAARVNVNHPKGIPPAPRDYQDRIGSIRGVEFRPGEGLFGNLHFNPRHALAEQLAWDAAHQPRNVGFSHNVEARVVRSAAGLVVEEIVRVVSVDLVADPATTEGLFEQADPGAEARVLVEEILPRLAELERRLEGFAAPRSRQQWSATDERVASPAEFARALKGRGR